MLSVFKLVTYVSCKPRYRLPGYRIPEKFNCLLGCIFSGSSRGSFSKLFCLKRRFPSDFVKLGSEILYLILAEKIVVWFVCLFCLFVCCNNLSDFGLLFLKPFLKGKILRSGE